MTARERLVKWFKRTGSEILGWILIPTGIVLMPLPGPGMLILLSGVALLAPHYAWARRILDPLKEKAIEGAKYGVATIPRIVLSALGGVWLFALGIVWFVSPQIPEFSVLGFDIGPELPFAGPATAIGLVASAIVAWGLLAYSVRRWRNVTPAAEPRSPA